MPLTAARAPQVTIVECDRTRAATLEGWLANSGLHVEVRAESQGHAAGDDRPDSGHCYLVHASLWHGKPWVTGLEVPGQAPKCVIVLMEEHDARSVLRAVRAGAMDVLLLPASQEETLSCVQRVLSLDRESQVRRRAVAQARGRLENLSRRERQVLGFVLEGYSNKRMSEALGVSIKTIEAHRANLMRKCECRSVASLVKLALLAGEGKPEQAPEPGT